MFALGVGAYGIGRYKRSPPGSVDYSIHHGIYTPWQSFPFRPLLHSNRNPVRSQATCSFLTLIRLAGTCARSYCACCTSQLSALPPNTIDSLTDRKSTRLNSSHLGISYAV